MLDSLTGLRHVIIGNGVAGTICAETLRKLDGTSSVTLIGLEPYPLYTTMAVVYFLCCYGLSFVVRRLDPKYKLVS